MAICEFSCVIAWYFQHRQSIFRLAGRKAGGPWEADAPSNKGNKKEDKLGDKLGEKGDKVSGRRAHHPTKGNNKEDNGRQRPWEGGQAIQQRHRCVETMGDKRERASGRRTHQSNKGKQERRQAGREALTHSLAEWRQSLVRADAPSNKGKSSWETS